MRASRITGLRRLFMSSYLFLLMLPIYWMISMSLQPNDDILSGFSWWPENVSLDNYRTIFSDESWYGGYVNSLQYTVLNTAMSLVIALPAAYAFSRYDFVGDNHLFFWLLTNRMAPAAVFLLPVFQLYQNLDLFDTPLAVWILEGFMSGIPRAIDETAVIDGFGFPRFFVQIFLPLIRSGVGVTAFFCFMFSWVELLLARTLTSVDAKPIAATMTRTVSASGVDWGLLTAAGTLTLIPGAVLIWFVRRHIVKGFAMGRV
jgi:glycerol transport system permease protein